MAEEYEQFEYLLHIGQERNEECTLTIPREVQRSDLSLSAKSVFAALVMREPRPDWPDWGIALCELEDYS